MDELKIISPMLDNFAVGSAISDHNGVRCYPAMDETNGEKYIVKVISIPASRTQLDAFLLSGAYADEESAMVYFTEQAEELVKETQVLGKLAQLEGYFAYEKVQLVPAEEGAPVQVYLLGKYKRTLERSMQKKPMTYLGAVNLGLDLCAALTVCRRCGFLYSDLRPGNIYVTENNNYLIGDLGFLRLDSLKFASLPDRYHSAYTAPEIADAFSSLNTTIDVYAVGMILYQIYNNGELPVIDLESSEPITAPANADYEMSEIILKACATDPADRWEDPAAMGQALVSYMQRNGANDIPIVPPVLPVVEAPVSEDDVADVSDEAAFEPEETEVITEATEEIAEEPADDPSDELSDISLLLQPSEDETAPEYVETSVEYGEVSDEANEILEQIDELANHPVPDPVVAPEPIDVPIPEPIPVVSEPEIPDQEEVISEEDTENTVAAVADVDVTQEEAAASNEAIDTEVEETEAEETADKEATDEEAEETPDTATTVVTNEEPEEIDEAVAEPKKKKKGNWLLYVILALLLIGIITVGAYFYKNYYLLPVDSMTVEGKEDYVTITVETPIDESLITVVCKGQHGEVLTAPLKDGTVTFNDLKADTAYVITLKVSGFHKLSGEVTKGYSTPKVTEITAFNVYTGTTSGSVNVVFSVTGKDADSWKLTYSATGETEKTITLKDKNATVNGLTVGKEYTFTLESAGDMYLTGSNTVTHTVREPAYAQHLTFTEFSNGKLGVAWVAPKNFESGSWTVYCVDANNVSLDPVTIPASASSTAKAKAEFSGIDTSMSYTVTVVAKGMQNGVSETVAANAASLSNAKTTVAANGATVTWEAGAVPGPWTVTCTADGFEITEAVTTGEGVYQIEGLIPNTTYCVTIKAADGTIPVGGLQAFNTPKAEPFSFDNGGVTFTAEDFTANLCATNNVKGKWSSKHFANTFKLGDKAGVLVEKTKQHNYSGLEFSRVFAIYNKDGNLTNVSATTNEWYKMWPDGNACELDIPSMPTQIGEYTLYVYFNGQLVTTQDFTITE